MDHVPPWVARGGRDGRALCHCQHREHSKHGAPTGGEGASPEEIKGRARTPCGSSMEERGRDGAP
jgi:hypothetical protein